MGPNIARAGANYLRPFPEAKHDCDELTAQGIPATLENMAQPGTSGGRIPFTAAYPCQVVVKAEDLPRAQPIVEEFEERRRARETRGR